MRDIALVIHDIRSSLNVGALLRTADGLGIQRVYITGYTPYPIMKNDDRLPHIAKKINDRINKTSLGAAETVNWKREEDVNKVLDNLKKDGYTIAALEQDKKSILLPEFEAPEKIAIILGSEVEGISPEIMSKVDISLEIPMFGKKESFNVSAAAAMALYHCRF